jgi:hypothetical protein
MKHEDLILELEQIAGQLGVVIRYEKGDFDGGYCILKAERILVVNKRLSPQKKASVLALGMNAIGLDSIFLKPALREFIDDETARVRARAGVAE